jgi:myo-inositol catabolism protein IolC
MTNSFTFGYNKPLYVLPFDHRASFAKGLYNCPEALLTDLQKDGIVEAKKIIYDAFKKAVKEKIPKEQAAILVDEEFGTEILQDAARNGFNFCLSTEKSGKEEFDLEYGLEFKEHIEKFNPTFVKALVRFNPDNDSEINKKQIERLKIISDYCRDKKYLFMLEVLVPPTQQQLNKVENQVDQYEDFQKPILTAEAIDDFYTFDITPDVWKLEGMSKIEDYEKIAERIRVKGKEAGIVVLGRGEKREMVEKWIAQGAKVKGVIGFAVGRTVFWQAVLDFKENRISREQAVETISSNYHYFYNLFLESKNS